MSASIPKKAEKMDLVKERLLPGETEAILTHKYYLSQKAGHDVGLDYAILDWEKHHATKWREQRMRKDVEVQFCEMMRHKWVESQKAGHDLGKQALIDWICKYAKNWRKCRERIK